MAKSIDSDALGAVNRALGIFGQGARETTLHDGTVEQVLVVNELARRGRTFAGSGGFFRASLVNIHAAANAQASSISPYAQAVGAVAPFPDLMPDGFDVWALGASATKVSGAGSLDEGAGLFLNDIPIGIGVDSTGAAALNNITTVFAMWITERTLAGGTHLQTPAGEFWVPIQMRIPRAGPAGTAVNLSFTSDTNGVATYACNILLGVFPSALGQDAQY